MSYDSWKLKSKDDYPMSDRELEDRMIGDCQRIEMALLGKHSECSAGGLEIVEVACGGAASEDGAEYTVSLTAKINCQTGEADRTLLSILLELLAEKVGDS